MSIGSCMSHCVRDAAACNQILNGFNVFEHYSFSSSARVFTLHAERGAQLGERPAAAPRCWSLGIASLALDAALCRCCTRSILYPAACIASRGSCVTLCTRQVCKAVLPALIALHRWSYFNVSVI